MSEPERVVVEGVCLSTPGVRVAKLPQDEAFLGPHGFVGDRHEAEFRRARFGDGVVANQRQWTAVASEEVAEVCAEIGVPPFAIGELGENLHLSGLRLVELAPGTILEFPSGARLLVAGKNDPCVAAARELSLKYGELVQRYFMTKSFGRRGVIGSVLEVGAIKRGDVVTVVRAQLPLGLDRSS